MRNVLQSWRLWSVHYLVCLLLQEHQLVLKHLILMTEVVHFFLVVRWHLKRSHWGLLKSLLLINLLDCMFGSCAKAKWISLRLVCWSGILSKCCVVLRAFRVLNQLIENLIVNFWFLLLMLKRMAINITQFSREEFFSIMSLWNNWLAEELFLLRARC